MAKRVAELFVEILAAAGAERIYGVAGDSLNGITDSVRRRNGIEWVGLRHEETAAFAAGAEAALTGRLGVCAGSCGPGNLHLINGLYDATEAAFQSLPSPHTFHHRKSGVDTSRKPTRNRCSRSAAISASWSPTLPRCRARLKSQSRPRSQNGVCPWSCYRVMLR